MFDDKEACNLERQIELRLWPELKEATYQARAPPTDGDLFACQPANFNDDGDSNVVASAATSGMKSCLPHGQKSEAPSDDGGGCS